MTSQQVTFLTNEIWADADGHLVTFKDLSHDGTEVLVTDGMGVEKWLPHSEFEQGLWATTGLLE